MIYDLIIFVVTVLFGLFMIPQLIDSYNGMKINKYTPILTTLGLATFTWCFFELGLAASSAAMAFETVMYSGVTYFNVVNWLGI